MAGEDDIDWKAVSISLAATDERMCRMILAADALALEVERMLEGMERQPAYTNFRAQLVQKALEKYKVVREGS